MGVKHKAQFSCGPNCHGKVILDDVILTGVPFLLWDVFKLVILSVDRRTYSITSVTSMYSRLCVFIYGSLQLAMVFS